MKNVLLILLSSFFTPSLCTKQFKTPVLQYQLNDLGSSITERKSWATSINDYGQVAGIISPARIWFVFSNNNIEKIHISLPSSILGIGCAPYLNNLGIISEVFINNHGQYLVVENNKLFLCHLNENHKRIIDSDSNWEKPDNGIYLRLNNNAEVAGVVKTVSGKKQAKYINAKSNLKKILPIKYSCTVTGINDLGDVIGWFQKDGLMHSFLWKPYEDNWQIIENFRAASINNNRIIVGSYQNISGIPPKGALWENGHVAILDNVLDLSNNMTTELETIEVLNSINNNNEMVGWGRIGGPYDTTRAVLIRRLSGTPVKRLEQPSITLIVDPIYEQKEYERLSLECSKIAEQFTAMGAVSLGSPALSNTIAKYLKNIGTPVAMRVLKDQVKAGRVSANHLKN